MLSPTIRGNRARMRLLAVFQAMLLVASLVAIAPVAAADPSPDPSTAATPSVEPTAPPPTPAPTPDPTPTATPGPTPAPSVEPSVAPSAEPSIVPSFEPSSSVAPSPSTIAPRIKTGAAGTGPLVASVGALQLNGTTQYATLGTTSQLGSATFTVELWFKRTGAGIGVSTGSGGGLASVIPLITKGRGGVETTADDINYFLGIDATSGKLEGDFEEGAGGASPGLNHPITGTAVIAADSVWHHAAATYDGTTWNLYLDGVLDGTLSVGRPANAANSVLTAVGSARATTGAAHGFFAGTIDEVRIWSVARSLSQINATKNSEITSPQTNLLGVWNLNEGSGSSLGDNSGNSITGAAVASPTWVAGFDPPTSNSAPNAPTVNAPANGAIGISTSPTLSVGVSDPNTDPLTVTFFGRPFASGNFAQIGQNTGVASGATTTKPWASLGAGQKFEWYVTVADATLTTTGPTWTFSTTASTDPVFVGAGDIADCTRTQDEATGAVIGGIQGNIWTAGDNVYQNGTATEFATCYDAGWGGAIKARTRPIPGNHDWNTGNLNGYTGYFGAAATDANGKSYYSYDIASSNWHIVNLDSECALVTGGCLAGSPQELWLKADLAANSTKNVIALMHKPRYSSAVTNLTDLQAFYTDFYKFGVDILLQGHDHVYERMAPINAAGVADATYGVRQFTVGTGGAALQGFGTILPASQVRNSATFGVMKFTLHATTYDWVFLPMAGQTFTDSGSGTVHAAPPNVAPVAVADSYSTPVSTPLNVSLPGVLTNDTDANGDPLTAVLNTNVTHGSLTLNANGSFLYTPTTAYTGPDSFTYHANDGALNSNVVTVSLTVTASSGNKAIDLGSAGAYVTFGDPAKLDLGVFTVETWFKKTGTGTPNQTGTGGIASFLPLLTHGAPEAENSNVDANWMLGINTAGNVIAADFEDTVNGTNHPISGTTAIADNVWHHAAATFNGTTWAVYLDGNLEASVNPGVVPRSDSIQRVALGAMITSTGSAVGRFQGVIDEARVWSVAHTQGQIQTTMNSELTSGTNLVARWGLNEGSGTSVGDSIATAANGTITGTGSSWVSGFVPAAGGGAPAVPTLNAPANAGTGISTSPTLSVGVTDPDADPMTVTFFGRPLASGNFSQIASNSAVVSGTNSTTTWSSLGAGQTYEWYVTVGDGTHTTTGPTWTFHTVASADPVFVGVGDIASCAVTEDTATGNIIAGIDGNVWTTGDNVYDNGTAAEFTNCYATTPWGTPAVKNRTRPVPGNHDWGLGVTDSLAGYNGYYGAAATDANGKSYYSYDIPSSNWHIVNLDTECALVGGCNAGSAQEIWLRADLAANSGKNVIAEWHRPRYSSGTTNTQELQPLWDALYAAGVDILLDGHDHIYERTVPMKSGATLSSPPVADPTYGITQFTVGTGGEGHHGLVTPLPTSVVRDDTTFGIMKFTLHATTYDWKFLPIAGSTFTDSGTGTVHAAPSTSHTLSGTVTAGSGLSGAIVYVFDSGTSAYVANTTTGGGGAYSISLPAGHYKLWIQTNTGGYPDQAYGPDGTFANATAIDLSTTNQTANVVLVAGP